MKKTITLIFFIFIIVMLPIAVSMNKNSENINFIVVEKDKIETSQQYTLSFKFNITEAGCGSHCQAKKLAKKLWDKLLGGISGNIEEFGSPVGGAVKIPFGGRVATVYPCLCNGKLAFTILPTAGPPGPYVVNTYDGLSIKDFGLIYPSNQVIGGADGPSVCSIPVGPWCFTFPAYGITATPGVGTSLTPI